MGGKQTFGLASCVPFRRFGGRGDDRTAVRDVLQPFRGQAIWLDLFHFQHLRYFPRYGKVGLERCIGVADLRDDRANRAPVRETYWADLGIRNEAFPLLL